MQTLQLSKNKSKILNDNPRLRKLSKKIKSKTKNIARCTFTNKKACHRYFRSVSYLQRLKLKIKKIVITN